MSLFDAFDRGCGGRVNQRAAKRTHGFPISSTRKLDFPIQRSLLKENEFRFRAPKSVLGMRSFIFPSGASGNFCTFWTYFYLFYSIPQYR